LHAVPVISISTPKDPTCGTPATRGRSSSYRPAMVMVTTLFFVWGFMTVLNDILIPHLKAIFTLSYAGVMFVQFSFFVAYFLMALPSSKLINAVGYKMSMVIGLLTMGSGALLFVPAGGFLPIHYFL